MHIVAAARGEALACAGQRMANHRIAALDHLYRAADLLDPARVLMSHDIWQFHRDHVAPQAFDHVQIGAANAGAADTHDDIGWFFDLRLRNILVADEIRPSERLIVIVKNRCLHSSGPPLARIFVRAKAVYTVRAPNVKQGSAAAQTALATQNET